MKMTKLNVTELTDTALDWAVAKCEGMIDPDEKDVIPVVGHYWDDEGVQWPIDYTPSQNWEHAGTIIAREQIDISSDNSRPPSIRWQADNAVDLVQYGPTPQVAAMRLFVAMKTGETIQVPASLLEEEQAEEDTPKKFRVTVTETTVYEAEIEAFDEEAACQWARGVVAQGDLKSFESSEVVDRQIHAQES